MPGLSELSLRGRRVLVRTSAVFVAMRQMSSPDCVIRAQPLMRSSCFLRLRLQRGRRRERRVGRIVGLIGRENVFESLNDALARAEQGLPHAARDGTVSHEI
jgi:hypothetical protein